MFVSIEKGIEIIRERYFKKMENHNAPLLIDLIERSMRNEGLKFSEALTILDILFSVNSKNGIYSYKKDNIIEAAALLSALFAAMNSGSAALLCTIGSLGSVLKNIFKKPLIKQKSLNEQNDRNEFFFSNLFTRIMDILTKLENNDYDNTGIFKDIVAFSDVPDTLDDIIKIPFRPIILKKIYLNGKRQTLVYFYRNFIAEVSIILRFRYILNLSINIADRESLKRAIEDVSENLDIHQRIALALSLKNSFTVISGGPGTGKTTLIIAIIRAFIRIGLTHNKIIIATPTGRAAERINSALSSLSATLSKRADNETHLADKLLKERNIILKLSAATIHRTLGYKPSTGSFRYNNEKRIPAEILIIDEVSMVSPELMRSTVEAMPDNCRLILIGDKDQLPPVDTGAVLSDLVPGISHTLLDNDSIKYLNSVITNFKNELSAFHQEFKIVQEKTQLSGRVIILKKNYRSASGISSNASFFISGAVKKAFASKITRIFRKEKNFIIEHNNLIKGNVVLLVPEFTQYTENAYLEMIIKDWVDYFFREYYFQNKENKALPGYLSLVARKYNREELNFTHKQELELLFKQMENNIILSVVNRGRYGTKNLNTLISRQIKKKLKINYDDTEEFPGKKIIITRNNYELNLFNGETGIILQDQENRYFAVFQKSGIFKDFSLEQIEPAPAFAITVHKSQGSGFGNVFFIMPNIVKNINQKQLLTADILYTAITRAENSAIICTNEDMLFEAASNKIIRVSGISDL